MTRDELAIAGAAALALLFMIKSKPYPPLEAWGTGWRWPIPDLVDKRDATRYPALISQEFRASTPSHFGVDLMYREAEAPRFFAPSVPVVAARAGKLWSVTRTPRGWAVVVDHGAPWATFYQHLDQVAPELAPAAGQLRTRSLDITAGQRLGTMGTDPLDPQHVRHLHFACWYQGAGDSSSVDPAPVMPRWERWNLETLI